MEYSRFRSAKPEDIFMDSKKGLVLDFINNVLPDGDVIESTELIKALNLKHQDLGSIRRDLSSKYAKKSEITGFLYWGRPKDVARIR